MITEKPNAVVNLSNQKFYSQDFSNRQLRNAKMNYSSFINCNFDYADMSRANCEGSNFFGSSFNKTNLNRANFKDAELQNTNWRPCDMYGLTWTMTCKTFRHMKMSSSLWHCFLFFVFMVEPDAEGVPPVNPKNKYINLLGKERFIVLEKLFKSREM